MPLYHLRLTTLSLLLSFSLDFTPIISQFGIYGDGIERVTKDIYSLGFNVLCSSQTPNVTIYWQFVNGSQIGISNRGFRAGHFENGLKFMCIIAITLMSMLSYFRYCCSSNWNRFRICSLHYRVLWRSIYMCCHRLQWRRTQEKLFTHYWR